MRLYGSGRSFESCGTTRLLGRCAVWFCFAAGATASASAGSSLLHYAPGGFSYEVSLRSYEGSGQQPRSQRNTPPQAVSRVITAPANEDSTIILSANDADDGSVMFFLTSLPATGKIYQYVGKARGALIQPGGTVADAHHRVIYAPVANGSGAPHSHFDFVANDRKGISAPATVTLKILPPEQPRFVDIKRVAGGSCQLLFEGHAHTGYRISASSDLITWQDIGVPIQTGSELFAYEDKEAPQLANRFYRVRVSDTPPSPEFTAIERQSDGSCMVGFSGGAYWPHRVWASSDLLEWKLLGTAEETGPGTFKYTDTDASSRSHRFYRASCP